VRRKTAAQIGKNSQKDSMFQNKEDKSSNVILLRKKALLISKLIKNRLLFFYHTELDEKTC
jgi:hypothetical protein